MKNNNIGYVFKRATFIAFFANRCLSGRCIGEKAEMRGLVSSYQAGIFLHSCQVANYEKLDLPHTYQLALLTQPAAGTCGGPLDRNLPACCFAPGSKGSASA